MEVRRRCRQRPRNRLPLIVANVRRGSRIASTAAIRSRRRGSSPMLRSQRRAAADRQSDVGLSERSGVMTPSPASACHRLGYGCADVTSIAPWTQRVGWSDRAGRVCQDTGLVLSQGRDSAADGVRVSRCRGCARRGDHARPSPPCRRGRYGHRSSRDPRDAELRSPSCDTCRCSTRRCARGSGRSAEPSRST